MDRAVVKPRKDERLRIESAIHQKKPINTPSKTAYKYAQEGLGIRVKGFWVLPKAKALLDNVIPGLSHECDGLILQVKLFCVVCVMPCIRVARVQSAKQRLLVY